MISIKGTYAGNAIDVTVSFDSKATLDHIADIQDGMLKRAPFVVGEIIAKTPEIIDVVAAHLPIAMDKILSNTEALIPLHVKLGLKLRRQLDRLSDLYDAAMTTALKKVA